MISIILTFLIIANDMKFITAVECWQRKKRIYRAEITNQGLPRKKKSSCYS